MNKDIVFNSKHFASIYSFEEMEEGLNFLTNDNSFIQVGTWKYEKNQILDAHYHNYFERKSYRTQEVVCLLYTSPSPRDISGSRMPSSA